MKQTDGCGLCGIYPKWLSSRATTKMFLLVYGILGMVQAMAFIYIVVTLTTLEKRFKIPSQTTGIILSGNEISQILSLILIYYGGSGHRPRWLATGVGLSAVSCFVLALPHAIYGPGKDALALTQEYLDRSILNDTESKVNTDLSLCPGEEKTEHCNAEDVTDASALPRFLIFFSQFILGIGTTLYFGLGQVYLDDNTEKKDTPLLLGCTFSLRTVGPAIGFVLGYACLSLYIDPILHPVINQNDPRWLGAWWLGWIILGSLLAVLTCLIAMFPRELPQPKPKENKQDPGEAPLKYDLNFYSSNPKDTSPEVSRLTPIEEEYKPTLRDFPVTLKRVMLNKIILCNSLAATCGILGVIPYITYLAKYLEVQFSTPAAGGTVVTGTISLIGMVMGFLISGFVISKFKPAAAKLLSWNVFVGVIYFGIIMSFIFVECDGPRVKGLDLQFDRTNFTEQCNIDCNCEGVKYAPVCHVSSMTTYYSACHAGCTIIIDGQDYGNCSCVSQTGSASNEGIAISDFSIAINDTMDELNFVKAGPCPVDCTKAYVVFSVLSTVTHILISSGKIGNILVNYRCVEKRDKSFAQGVTLTFVSLFGLIPGPIIFGALIDSTCLIWDHSCGAQGNCWYYDKEDFRYIINSVSATFILCSAILDGLLCYLARNLDLYGLKDDKRLGFVKDIIASPSANSPTEVNGMAPSLAETPDDIDGSSKF
ncbi:solute carrier organic anion transporter family member 74D isoform X2 [Venturia canescens]|uniref:solute carrier organic anion transporter family member 74D isoform X2 n=1 Tax=Venturia canescens TaxID=32260 RepID=UPI001C9D5BF0|nr:solute carrier organic anion transporter family member 74D isoform X2 [Venturia canescens]